MEIIKRSASRSKILFSVGIIVVVAIAFASCASASSVKEKGADSGTLGTSVLSGSGVAERQLLGLCTHNPEAILAGGIPASERPKIRNLRLNISWANVEKEKGVYSWPNTIINQALQLGVNSIMVTLGQPIPSWAANPNTPVDPTRGPPRDNNDFYDFCRAFAARYQGIVDFFQIWQEPGWDLDAPPAAQNPPVIYFYGNCDFDYMGLLRAGYNGIKAGNPDAYVLSGGMLNGITRSADNFAHYEALLAGANQDISMKVEAGDNIVAERPMYFNYHNVYPGGDVELGVKTPGTVWYLAEGATHPGFDEWICVQNPGDAGTLVNITYMFPGGGTQGQQIFVGAHSRATVDVNGAVGQNRDVSAKLVSEQPIVVERPMYFNYQNKWTGGSIESAISELSTTWYLAEGATQPGFEQWISLMNPNGENTDVTLTYMFKGGGTQVQKLTMPKTSRETIMVNNIVGPNKDVSTKIESTQPIIAERPMYFNYHGAWQGGHSEVGATEAQTSWFLSEGTTRSNADDGAFEEWISIQNPGDTEASVDLTYMYSGGSNGKGRVTVPAHARETVFVNNEIGPNKDVSVQLDSTQPIIVERPMYFSYHNSLNGGSVEVGCNSTAKTWYFAEGTTRQGFQEWLTLQNPNAGQTNATITFMFGDGTTQQKMVALPARSRTTISVNQSVSLATICDGIAVHPYDYPEYWSWYYNYVKSICAKNGYPNHELVASEIGWPHSGRAEFSPEGQRLAIGDQGVGSLWGAGCRKIWIYEDVDDPPGNAFEANFGMFYYNGSVTPAWGEYTRWQSVLLDYGNKPGSL